MKPIRQSVAGVLVALGVATLWYMMPEPVSAQTPAPKVFTACYVPLAGLVYLVGEEKTPADCLLKTHVKFSWNQQGPKGDKGDKGDPGVAGNLALAGQTCPAGQFVTGFSSGGTIVCVAQGAEAPPPPPPPPAPFVGTWALTPTISTPCTGSPFIPSISMDQIMTSVSSPGQLSVVARTKIGGFTTFPSLPVAFDQAAGTFAGSSGQVTQQVTGSGVSLTVSGSIAITGGFTGPDGPLTATVELSGFTFVGTALGPVNAQCNPVT